MDNYSMPLAERMRPNKLSDFVGQKHIVGENMLLCRAIKAKKISSMIFYGPPGIGKTTLANIVANEIGGNFVKLSAISNGTADAKKVIDDARKNLMLYGKPTILLLDECHRWSKAQSDCLLGAIEDGTIIFVGSTTENPYTSMTPAIISRCKVFEFTFLSNDDIVVALKKALADKEKGLGELKIVVSDEVLSKIAFASGGDLRSALSSLELASLTTDKNGAGEIVITDEVASQSTMGKTISIDIDLYYDYLSAYCKSIRGSDADSALFYMQRLVIAGIDPQILARRLVAHCSEDIGMADSNAVLLAMTALFSCKELGYPECMLTLTHAVIYACQAEKSNSVVVAKEKSEEDAKKFGKLKPPFYLLNHLSINDTKKTKYKYPHDYGGYVSQQYMPDEVKDHRYYIPSQNGKEKNVVIKKLK